MTYNKVQGIWAHLLLCDVTRQHHTTWEQQQTQEHILPYLVCSSQRLLPLLASRCLSSVAVKPLQYFYSPSSHTVQGVTSQLASQKASSFRSTKQTEDHKSPNNICQTWPWSEVFYFINLTFFILELSALSFWTDLNRDVGWQDLNQVHLIVLNAMSCVCFVTGPDQNHGWRKGGARSDPRSRWVCGSCSSSFLLLHFLLFHATPGSPVINLYVCFY